MEENLCFKIDWASLMVGSKFAVIDLFYFVFEGNVPSTSTGGCLLYTSPSPRDGLLSRMPSSA